MKNNQRIFSKDRAGDLLQPLKYEPLEIKQVDRQLKKQHTPHLYDLTSFEALISSDNL